MLLGGQPGRIQLHAAEGGVAAQDAGDHQGVQHHAVAVAVVPVHIEQDRQVTDDQAARHVDQERADRKIATIVLADHTPGQPAQQ